MTGPTLSLQKPTKIGPIIEGQDIVDICKKLAELNVDAWEQEDVQVFLEKTLSAGGVSGQGKSRKGAMYYGEVLHKMDDYGKRHPTVTDLLDPYLLVLYPVISPAVRVAMAAYPNPPMAHNGIEHIIQFPGSVFVI